MLSFSSVADIAVDAIKEVNDVAEESELETEETKRKSKVREHWDDMIDNTSFHGINYIVDERYPIRRVFWLVVTVSAFIYSLTKVHESTMEYLEYPFETSVMRRYFSSNL